MREKVIDGLVSCMAPSPDGCWLCPYMINEREWDCRQLQKDALRLIRPRVLTLEEATQAEVCWVEARGTDLIGPGRVLADAGHVIIQHIGEGVTIPSTDYGTGWRCWSARPTDEQREAVEW